MFRFRLQKIILWSLIFAGITVSYGEAQIQRVLATANINVGGASGGTDDTAPALIIDDFSDINSANSLGGASGTFENGGTAIIDVQSPFMELSFDVNAGGSFSGYFTLLEGLDVSSYGSFVFDVSGGTGNEDFRIELKSSGGVSTVFLGDVNGSLQTSLQNVRIPFSSFQGNADFTALTEIVFVFENTQLSSRGNALAGVVNVDNIEFQS